MFDSNTYKIPTIMVMRMWLVGPYIAFMFSLYSLGYYLLGKLENGAWWLYPIVWPYKIVFALLNVLFNFTAGSFIYWEMPPKGVFFTTRTQYYIDNYPEDHPKHEMAEWFSVFVNRPDPDHIKDR